ncbi:MAG: acyl-CoA dehydrogenase family protein [Bacteriovoracaceae bacterium]
MSTNLEFLNSISPSLHKFGKEKVEPFNHEDDVNEFFRWELWKGFGELGVTGITTPEQFGGAGLGLTELSQVLEIIAQYNVAYSVTISVSSMVQSIIKVFGNSDQQQKYLPALASGEEIGAFALTEPEAGSDAASLKTKATVKNGSYVLNGTKMFISSGGIAKTYIVFARTGEAGARGISAFIVRDGTPGFRIGKKEKKMGWKSSPTCELIFDNCTIPKENLLSTEGNGFKIAMSALDRGRVTVGAASIGLAQKALDESVKYALYRKQFNQSIYEFQGIQFLVAELATEIEAARLLVAKAATNFDNQTIDSKIASMAKLKATDVAMRVTTEAVQIMGGVGYTAEFPLERYMRDAKVTQIVEGTNQIQKIIIAKQIKKELENI